MHHIPKQMNKLGILRVLQQEDINDQIFDFCSLVIEVIYKVSLIVWISCRYETESSGKIEELEHAKMKLQARLSEAEETIEGIVISNSFPSIICCESWHKWAKIVH